MESLPTGKKTAQVHPMRRSLPLTLEDSKVLGKITERRKEKTTATQKFNTRAFKHINSSWTPIVHKPSNEQIYKERRELVCNWFDMWTDSQRKRFLDLLFRHCHRRQLYFIQHWFDERVPLKHLDFTRVLPRFLTLKIFSYLDPRSLSRASMVSWNWKFLTEQDDVWRPKCARLGWFLPYEPSDNEYGAWKRHYIACTQSLDVDIPSKNTSDLYGTMGDGSNVRKRKGYKKSSLKADIAEQVLTARPAWRPPDSKPEDLEKAKKALLNDWNPNDPNVPPALLLYHNKFGQLKNSKLYQNDTEYGLTSSQRKGDNRALNSGEELGLDNYRESLTKQLDLERYEEKRMMQLTNQPWEPPPPVRRAIDTGPNLTGGAGTYGGAMRHKTVQKMSKSYPHQENPRVVFISSRVPAADVLMDAVMFGVVPIVYEYEGTTLESLLSQLDACLQGRNAQSIGIFTHTELSWEVRMVHGSSITVDNLEEPAHVAFFETIASHVLPPEKGGHIDFFVPLGSSVPGTDLMTQLTSQTGMLFTSPTGIVGNYNHVSGEWSSQPEGCEPPTHYFCPSKMNVWSNTADTAKEACDVTKKVLGRYFEQKQRDVASQLVGQVVFDVLGQTDVQGVNDLTTVLTDGLVELAQEQNNEDSLPNVNAYEYLGQYLLQKSEENASILGEQAPPNGTLAPTKAMRKPASLSQQISQSELEDQEVEHITSNGGVFDDDHEKEIESQVDEGDNYNSNNNIDLCLEHLDSGESGDEEEEEDLNCNNNCNGSGDEAERPPREGQQQQLYPRAQESHRPQQTADSRQQGNGRRQQSQTHKSADFALTMKTTSDWGDTVEMGSGSQTARTAGNHGYHPGQNMPGSGEWALTQRSHDHNGMEHWAEGTPPRLTNKQLQVTTDRRTAVAKEVLSSEITYLRTLEIIKNTFFLPLKNALASNRAIISAHNVQIIFSDVMTLCSITKRLVDELRNRCSQWDSQSCLGDIFVKLSGKLKAYVNFLNNYPMILGTLDRSMEQVPLFRAFLKRHEKTPETRMLTLAELLLIPTRRIQEYCNLLAFFECNTPPDHADRTDLQRAITTMGDLQQLIVECKDRSQRERELLVLQKTIVKCPTLLESNRYLLRHLDVAHLKPPADSITPENRIYQHIEMIGLYMFNDALVVTKRSTKNFPFERSKEYIYVFEAVTGLLRLRVEDIPDSKYARNAFRLYTPRRSWVCGADSSDDKFNYITLVEKTVRAAINNK